MKIEKTKGEKFIPVIIEIETEEELEFFYLIGNCCLNDFQKVFDGYRMEKCSNWGEIRSDLYDKLCEYRKNG